VSLPGQVQPGLSASTFAPHEYEVLARFWHPIAYSHDVRDGPVAATLLDLDLVAYRTDRGVVVAKDLCLHRGSRLTMGRMVGNELECAYHGWRYGAEGRCTRIPAQPPDRRIPPRARLFGFPSVERHGLVWTCLAGEPAEDLPDWPETADPAYRWMGIPAQTWRTSAARMVENFLDVSHFAFVHRGTFGSDQVEEVPDFTVEDTRSGLRAEYPWPQRNPEYPGEGVPPTVAWPMSYSLSLPFSARITVHYPDRGADARHVVFCVASPRAAKEVTVFKFACRNFDHDLPEQDVIGFDAAVLEEDRPIVESQRPEELPLDLTEELHVQSDRMTIAYRKALARLGLGAVYSR
jgi:vanillate O-demethylase monooxygenase subunit